MYDLWPDLPLHPYFMYRNAVSECSGDTSTLHMPLLLAA